MRAAFVTAGLLLLAAAFARAESVETLGARGELVVLTFPDELNQFTHPEGDGYDGLDLDILRGFGRKIGVPIRVVVVERFDDLIPALLEGRGDVIGSSFTITTARKRVVDFSSPYFPIVLSVIGREPCDLATEADFSGRTAAVVTASSQMERLAAFDVELLTRPSFPKTLTAVRDGEADFTLTDSTSSLVDLQHYPELGICFDLDEIEHYGFAVRPGSEWLEQLDEHVKELLASGHYYYEMIQVHLGVDGARFFAVTDRPGRRD